jgi:hypothetical protein
MLGCLLVYPAKMNNPNLAWAYREMTATLSLWDKAVIISLQFNFRGEYMNPVLEAWLMMVLKTVVSDEVAGQIHDVAMAKVGELEVSLIDFLKAKAATSSSKLDDLLVEIGGKILLGVDVPHNNS